MPNDASCIELQFRGLNPRIADDNASGFVGDDPRPTHAAERFRDGKSGLQPVLMEARPEIGSAKPGVVAALQRPQLPLRPIAAKSNSGCQ